MKKEILLLFTIIPFLIYGQSDFCEKNFGESYYPLKIGFEKQLTWGTATYTEKVTGTTIAEYMSKKVWKPIGAKNAALWSLDTKDGREKAYCCFYSNARDFARIGKLYLNEGIWNKRRIINQNYIEASTCSPYGLKDKNGKPVDFYGYQMWMTYYKDMDIFYARGIQGQFIIVN